MSIINKYSNLPIADIASEVCASLAVHSRLIVTAPPGAGKSTLLPLALLGSMAEGKILMLEPRRIAARQVAARMAEMLGEDVGQTVGYRVRFDTRVSAHTRIEVITEGILERMLVDDPTLEGVGAVVFDEFHERSLSSDLSLALTREIQNELRPDLKILIMSATIDADSLARQLDAPQIHASGRCHNVEIVYAGDFDINDCAASVARCIRAAYRSHPGNILAFLPGQAQIIKCRDLLAIDDAEILTLYGAMPPEQQHRVMLPPQAAVRRIVLATPIAETSLTIEGITVVVDSGLCRTPVFDPSTGLSRLVTTRISADMATQRAGRAGRLADGICYRMWSKATNLRMSDCRQPEILVADLSSMLLTAAAWGVADASRLLWITPPPMGHLANGRQLLQQLEAIDDSGRLTPLGKRIAQLSCHARIARMLVDAGSLRATACDVAALLEEKDPLHDDADADISTRIALLEQYRRGKMPTAWTRIDNVAAQYRRLVKADREAGNATPEQIGSLVAMAYPERIAMRLEFGRYRLAAGSATVQLHCDDDLARHEFLAMASMGASAILAAPLSREYIMSKGQWRVRAMWSSREGRAVVRDELHVGLLTVATRPINSSVREAVTAAVVAAAPKEGLTMFDFNDDVQSLQTRIAVAALWHPELALPDVGTECVLASASDWLPLYIGDATSAQELRKIDMQAVILAMLSYDQQQELDRIAPTHVVLPNGRRARIQYRRGADAPVVSARLQDCFGMTQTPRVDGGTRPVLMELLSPGFKPVQLTQDMEGFWRNTYFEVRKELRRRYPKHNWPEKP